MPCTITGSLAGDRELFAKEALDMAQQRNVMLTQLLCEACQAFERKRSMPKYVRLWWEKHQKQDKRNQ